MSSYDNTKMLIYTVNIKMFYRKHLFSSTETNTMLCLLRLTREMNALLYELLQGIRIEGGSVDCSLCTTCVSSQTVIRTTGM